MGLYKGNKMPLLKIILALVVILVLSTVIYFLVLQGVAFKRKSIEVQRVSSPDGKVDFVVCESDTGAMSSLVISVYVVEATKRLSKEDIPVFSADYINGRDINWSNNNLLEIKYEKASIFNFRNNVRPLKNDPSHLIEIKEVSLGHTALKEN